MGFSKSAFTKAQLKKHWSLTGGWRNPSFYKATEYKYLLISLSVCQGFMRLIFLISEKRAWESSFYFAGESSLRGSQQLYTAGITTGLLALFIFFFFLIFRLHTQKTMNIIIFNFLQYFPFLSCEVKRARIYGHYTDIAKSITTFYRHTIHHQYLNTISRNMEEKWMAYKFTKNVYERFMTELHKLICSVIEEIKDVDFEVSAGSRTTSKRASSSQNSSPSKRQRLSS